MKKITYSFIVAFLAITHTINSQNNQNYSNLLTNESSNSPLGYNDINTKGDRIIDFSNAGYKGGGVSIPEFYDVLSSQDIITLTPSGSGDDTQQIQNAINTISNRSMNSNGFRGGILLSAEVFHISQRINISKGGIIIKGSGGDIRSQQRTIIVDEGVGEWASFFIHGSKDPSKKNITIDNNEIYITDDYVPIGASSFNLSSTSNLQVGDSIIVNINPQQKWINDQQLNGVGGKWNNVSFFQDNMKLDRKIININNNTITLNAQVTSSINKIDNYNIGSIQKITEDNRIENIGFEDLILASDYNCSLTDSNGFKNDTGHASIGIHFYSGKNGWVKDLTGFFYSKSFIKSNHKIENLNQPNQTWDAFKNLTVQDCAMLDGISPDNKDTHAGGYDYSFDINSSSSLVQRSYGRNGRHTFTTNTPTNLIVFLDCLAENDHLSLGPHQNFSTGILFDNVGTDGRFELNSVHGSSHGQRTANSMLWNVTSYNDLWFFRGDIWLDKPLNDLGQQWLIGVKYYSTNVENSFYNAPNIRNPSRSSSTFASNPTYFQEPEFFIGESADEEHIGNHVYPRSIYLRQLKDRLGDVAVQNIAKDLQEDPNPDVVGENIFFKLKNKYDDIPEFMCLSELLTFHVESFCNSSEDSFLNPETWITQNANYSNYQFETGDFNGDNRDDVIAISKHNARFVVWESLATPDSNGNRFLGHHKWIQQDADYSNYQFEIGDFNGDGRDDVIAISKHNTRFVVWESLETPINGDRFLWHHKWIQQDADYSNYQFEIGDFTGDGRDDVIAIRKHDALFVVWESLETPINGDRFLWHHKWIQQDADYSNYQFEIGDFTGDGRDDVIAITKHDARFVVWESLETPINGDRFLWHHKWMQQDVDYTSYQFEIGDFTGNGRDDVIAINNNLNDFQVWESMKEPFRSQRFMDSLIWWDNDNSFNFLYDTFKIGNFNGDCFDEVISIESITTALNVWELGSEITTSSKTPNQKRLIGEEEKQIEVTIYPNPTTSKVIISSQKEINSIKVFSVNGMQLANFKNNTTEFNLNISNYSKGIYFVVISTGGKIKTEKIIKY